MGATNGRKGAIEPLPSIGTNGDDCRHVADYKLIISVYGAAGQTENDSRPATTLLQHATIVRLESQSIRETPAMH